MPPQLPGNRDFPPFHLLVEYASEGRKALDGNLNCLFAIRVTNRCVFEKMFERHCKSFDGELAKILMEKREQVRNLMEQKSCKFVIFKWENVDD